MAGVGGRAGELEQDLTLALVADALEPVVGGDAVAGLESEQLRELAAVLPGIGASSEVVPASLSGERHRVARAVRALLERLAGERPVAVVLDNEHRADPASVDVLALLLHRPPRGRVLLALAARMSRAPDVERAARPGDLSAVDVLAAAAEEVAPARRRRRQGGMGPRCGYYRAGPSTPSIGWRC